MKTSHSIVFFVLMLIAVAFIFAFIFQEKPADQKVLLQTLDCQSDKIDSSIYNLRGDTSLIGAFITFKNIPISDETRKSLTDMGVKLNEGSWIFDYVLAEIPTENLCQVVASDAVIRVFVPTVNQGAYKDKTI